MIILHGDNLVASRHSLEKQLEQAKAKKMEIIKLNGKNLSLTRLQQGLESKSLFGHEKLVMVENLLSLPSGKNRDKFIDYLKRGEFKNLILWEGKEIKNLKQFKGAKIQIFKLPATIFRFLDSFSPGGNKKESLSLLETCVKQISAEMVFYMLVGRIRALIMAVDLGQNGLNDLHPFQQKKISQQAKSFKLSQLLLIYRHLLKIDHQQKTGRAAMSLASQLDLLIASL